MARLTVHWDADYRLQTLKRILCVVGVGGHGGSGIHADLDDKYREIVTRVSNYASLRQPRPVVAVSSVPPPRQKAAVPTPGIPVAPPPPPPSSQNADRGRATPRAPVERGADRRGGGVGGTEHPSSGTGAPSARGTTASGGGSGHAQPVHVAKCTVCTILWRRTITRWLQLRFDCDSTALRPFDDLRH